MLERIRLNCTLSIKKFNSVTVVVSDSGILNDGIGRMGLHRCDPIVAAAFAFI